MNNQARKEWKRHVLGSPQRPKENEPHGLSQALCDELALQGGKLDLFVELHSFVGGTSFSIDPTIPELSLLSRWFSKQFDACSQSVVFKGDAEVAQLNVAQGCRQIRARLRLTRMSVSR